MDNAAPTPQSQSHFKSAPKSGLWQFFNLSQNGQKKIYNCTICKARFLYTGSTSVLSTHMKTKHPQYVRIAPKNAPSSSAASSQQLTSVKVENAKETSQTPEKSQKTLGTSSNTSSQKSSSTSTTMSAATPTKAKDKERIVKLLHESILHLCKVSVSGPGEIEVDGIVCITQPNDGDIVVKVHETFSNVHNSDKDNEDGRSPAPGEKRKAGSHGDPNKTPRKDDGRDRGDRQRTPVSRRLINDETLDLTGDEESSRHKSPGRARNKTSDVIDLTSGRDTPAPQLHISQVRSLGNQQQPQQRFNGPGQYNQRFPNYRPRGPYQQRPRQRFMGRPNMAPPQMRHMNPGQVGNNVVPIGGPIPHRAFPRNQNPNMMGPRGQTPNMPMQQAGNMNAGPVVPNAQGISNRGSTSSDVTVVGYKGLRCKYKDCGFSCSNKYYLETHVLQHFNSAAFSCNEEGCDFKTKNKQNLYQHYKVTHDATNPQFCLKCIQAFKSPEDLNTHAQSCQVMFIKCDHCGENIQGLVAMAKHLTEVYISESSAGDSSQAGSQAQPGQSPGHSSSTPSPGVASPGVSQSSMQSPGLVPDMSSPLNIIPDITSGQAQPTNPGGILIHQELEKLEQLSSDLQQQQQQQQMLAVTEPQMPGYVSAEDILQAVSQSNGSPHNSPTIAQGTMPYEVINNPSSLPQEPITLEVPVQMASDIQLPPGAEAITLELVPLGENGQRASIDEKPPDIGT